METNRTTEFLKKMLKEQMCCLGRIFARHEVPDDVIWEVVKGFDIIFIRIREQVEGSENSGETDPHLHKMEPHPGIMYLLEKLEK
jgi:hypothetical protein